MKHKEKSFIIDKVSKEIPLNSKWRSRVDIELTKSFRTANYSGVIADVVIQMPVIISWDIFEILEIVPFIKDGWLRISLKIKSEYNCGYVLIWQGDKDLFIEKDFPFYGFRNDVTDLNFLWERDDKS